MSMKEAQAINIRKSNNRNCNSLRTNSIRGISLNHSSLNQQPSINSSNQFAKPLPKTLTYYLGPGNNESIIKKVMSYRSNWVLCQDSTNSFVNLKWRQDQKGFKYHRLIDSGQYRTVLNHFQFHQNLSNKQFLFRNLEKYCLKNFVDLWKIVPPTFILNCKDSCCMQSLQLFVQYYQKYYPKTLKSKRGQTEVDKQIYEQRRKLRDYFFNCNLKKILPKNPPLYNVFLNKNDGDYLWIVKPTFLNRGRGIQIFSKLQDLTKFVTDNINGHIQKKFQQLQNDATKIKPTIDYIKKNFQAAKHAVQLKENCSPCKLYKDNNNGDSEEDQPLFDGNQYIRLIPNLPAIIKTDCFLVQKYLQKPLLIQNHKFDIRMWVLVTHTLKGYVFPQGYIRLSSFEYNCKDSKGSNFIHLTNNAVQKYSTDYGKVADGNQMSFKQLKQIMLQKQLNFTQCQQQIYNHIQLSLNSTFRKLNQANRKFCFQIFGYDFMIDQTGYPWLIQVNTNPCLQQSSKILKKLLPRMLDDAFRLTIDHLFYGSVSTANFQVEGYSKQNMWINLPLNIQN